MRPALDRDFRNTMLCCVLQTLQSTSCATLSLLKISNADRSICVVTFKTLYHAKNCSSSTFSSMQFNSIWLFKLHNKYIHSLRFSISLCLKYFALMSSFVWLEPLWESRWQSNLRRLPNWWPRGNLRTRTHALLKQQEQISSKRIVA